MTRPIVLQGDRKTVTKTGIGTFATVIFGAVIAFSTTLFVSNTVGDTGTGVFFQILAFFAIASTACAFGSDTALLKTLTSQLTLGHERDIWKTFLVALLPVGFVATFLATVLWFLAPALATLFQDAQAEQLIRILSVFVIPGSLSTALFGGLLGFGRVGTFTGLQNILLPCLRFIAVVTVILLGLNTAALAAAWVTPVALVLVMVAFVLQRTYRNSNVADANPRDRQVAATASPSTFAQARSFWSFAAGRGASSLLEIVLEWIDVVLVGVFLGPAAAGIYGVVNRCMRLGQMADHSARIVVGPMLGSAMAASDSVRAQTIYLMSTRILVLVAWPFYLVMLIGGPTLLTFFGPEFSEGYPALVIISVAMAVAVTAGGVQSVLLMAGRSRWQLYNKLAALAVALTGNLLLIPILGLRGAAISWAAAVLIDCALATWEVHHFLHLRVSIAAIILPAGLALSVYGVGLAASQLIFTPSWFNLLSSLALLTGVYASLLWRARVRLGLAALRQDTAGQPPPTAAEA